MTPKKVFIVDDADFMVDMLRMIVQQAGHQVVGTAFNGADALKSIESLGEKLAPDVATVDFHMPKMDGLETGRRIRLLVPGVKIILISSHATRPVAMMAKDVEVDAFIVKPFEPQMVLDAINNL